MKISSYPKVWALGHKETLKLLEDPVVVQEKVDGSQFSFGVQEGKLTMRSKGQDLTNQTGGMFARAITFCEDAFLQGLIPEGLIVRAEFLSKPKHNSQTYLRTPINCLAVFDMELPETHFLSRKEVQFFAGKLGLEVVPYFFEGTIANSDIQAKIKEWLELESFLGGAKIEGVVVKNYSKYDSMYKVLMGKFVSEAFKELHIAEWGKSNPKSGDVIQNIIASVNKEAVWQKAIQHKRDEGVLLDEPKDIGMLMGEIKKDFHEEYGEQIQKRIFREFYADIERGILRGFPEWYKQKLLENLTLTPEAKNDSQQT